jgi:hypothetical protein
MLYIFLQGGIGNQLFQYAAAVALQDAEREVSITKAGKAHSARDYRGIIYTRVPWVDVAPSGTPVRCLQSFPAWKIDDYKGLDNTVLQGYFQYLPAIQEVLPQVRSDLLKVLATYQDTLRVKYNITSPSSTGFIHVRRGDYLTAPPCHHWIMDTHYYRMGLTAIDTQLRWIVLSDDIAWCREQELFTKFPMIEVADEPDELSGLALMSLCHGGAIIANSTFSWWGAMLGAEPAGAKVVYPSLWSSNSKPELFPSTWIRI